jgi:hypothetical protein
MVIAAANTIAMVAAMEVAVAMARPLRVGGSAVAAATTTTRDDRQQKHNNQHDNQIRQKHNDNYKDECRFRCSHP